MDKLDRYEIDAAQASAMAKLIAQAGNLLHYELKRAALMSNTEFRNHHRNLAQNNFDSLPEVPTIGRTVSPDQPDEQL